MKAEDLIARAIAVRANAYAPYSQFAVGAAIVTDDGSIFEGVNVENASYGLAICAERSAAVAAVAAGHRSFQAIAIAGPQTAVTAPCGACRQFLNEFNPRLEVAYTTPSGVKVTSLDKLLADAFGPKSFGISG
jgi:cytidine deaminase